MDPIYDKPELLRPDQFKPPVPVMNDANRRNKRFVPKIQHYSVEELQASLDEVCFRISSEEKTLKDVCKDMKLPFPTTWKMICSNQENIQKYEIARQEQATLLADDLLEIERVTKEELIKLKGNHKQQFAYINYAKMQCDNRKWLAAKYAPKRFGAALDPHQAPNVNILQQFFKPIEVETKAIEVKEEKEEKND